MRYLGSKIKLLQQIDNVIKENNIEGNSFVDLFAGTGCVGDYFKGRYRIVANDFLYYSYVFNRAKLMYAHCPAFSAFKKAYKVDVFEWLNNRSYTPDDSFFVYRNYTPVGDRMFFTENNGIKIDGIRQDIELLKKEKCISENEYYYLLASLLDSVTRFSNTSGTYEAFFKFWDKRAEKVFVIEPLEINQVDHIFKNKVFSSDANELVRKISGDIVYIDTPYTVTQYISAYHMLETIAKYDNPKITGVGGKRSREDKNSLYAQRSNAKRVFEDLLRQLDFEHVIISYSNQGLIPIEELIGLIRLFAVDSQVVVKDIDFREYQNHRSSNKGNGKNLKEVIIYFKQNRSINKSPLNYSGSKDTLLPVIQKNLPQNIETFVDVMGGAFNVGANISATKQVIYNEINPYVYGVIRWLMDTEKTALIHSIEKTISDFNLTKGGKDAYCKLRDAYNDNPSPLYLYVLHMYSFQNLIRFNGAHKFNTPIGVAGYSEDIKHRIEAFSVKSPECIMMNVDYTTIDWSSFSGETLFYFDPPYNITNAAYNDGKRGMKGWGVAEEQEMLDIIKHIDELGFKFILSNVL